MAEHFKETDHINKSIDNYNSVILGMERSNKGEYLLEHNWPVVRERIGEGNGTPLQYPRLENPMDRGAW